ncbi:MAG TPA: ABC transporter substrate-binding protein [Clostridiales bacterium]|nr:ABC transporter substrate-binding protein [Clostridiales bacterium]
MKKLLVCILTLALTLSLLTACGGAQSKPSESVPSEAVEPTSGEAEQTTKTTFGLEPFAERQTLRIGAIAGSQTAMPFIVAMGEGFFDELNIEVEMSTFTAGPAMMEANADWDIAAAGVAGNLVGAIGYDLPAVGVCDRETNQVLFVRKDSKIAKDPTNPELYKGTTWLLPLGTTAHYTLIKQLESLGLSMDEIKTVNMDVSSAYTAFNGGEGDGMVLFNTNVFIAEDAGYVRIADSGSLNATNSAFLTMTPDAIENERDLMITTWALFYLTADWINESEEHKSIASNYYLEHCEEEGIACTELTAMRTLNIWKCPSLSDSIATMTNEVDDDKGLFTERKLLQAESEMLKTMDFFVEQEKYKAEDRVYLLENKLVDNSITKDAVVMLDKLGITH